MNSASELEYHFILGRDIEAIPAGTASTLIESTIEVRKMIYGLLQRVATSKRFSTQHDIT